MVRQLDLFAAPAVAFDAGFGALRRHELAHGAWVDHQAGWVASHDLLFDELERGLAWKSEKMKMYDHTVPVPRLLAGIARTGAGLFACPHPRARTIGLTKNASEQSSGRRAAASSPATSARPPPDLPAKAFCARDHAIRE